MLGIVQYVTLGNFIMGVATVLLSLTVGAIFFRRSCGFQPGQSKAFSAALGWQLVGEAVIGFGTLLFTIAAHYDWLNEWSINTQSAIRFVMFFATSLTTWHLYRVINRILRS